MFQPLSIRKDFPILQRRIQGEPLLYFDNAATTQTPLCVLDTARDYYLSYNSNIHRSTHALAQQATQAHQQARTEIASYLHAASPDEVFFTSGTTEPINLVAHCLRDSHFIGKNDRILISHMEHHANLVPWQILCKKIGASLDIIPIDDKGNLDETSFDKLLTPQTRLLALSHVSNALGTINPIVSLIAKAKKNGSLTLIDGAQAIAHLPIDVQSLDCDFYAFSGHKIYGPTGIGVLYGKRAIMEQLPPWKTGGEMIERVGLFESTFNSLPYKFEAGTPDIEGAIALARALLYVQEIGIHAIAKHENDLLKQATQELSTIQDIQFFGESQQKAAVLSFLIKGIHPYDLATLLGNMGVALRSGHHCCQPLMDRFSITGTLRASFAMYNTQEEVARFIHLLKKAIKMLS